MSFQKYLIGGYIYEINIENLRKYPSLILNHERHMKRFYHPTRQMFCLARNRAFFEILVFYIHHGILSRPMDLSLDLFINELNYYFLDSNFVSKLKIMHSIPSLSYSTEIRYLPRMALKRFFWRAIEYNEGLFGPIYRFLFGIICLCSIFLFMYEIIIIQNEKFFEYTEQYVQKDTEIINVTVRSIDYRPNIKRLAFKIEISFVILWIVELVLRIFSAPNLVLCIKSIFFWIDTINILNSIFYILFSLKFNQDKTLFTHQIQSMIVIFQLIDILKTLRMIKLGKYHRSIELIIESFGEAFNYLLTLCVVLFGTSCVFGTMIYVIERATNPSSKILYPNVGNGVYYTILAITNVGFEGFLPTTYIGKWIACAAITIGILSIGLILPMILSVYTRRLLIGKKEIIYRDQSGTILSNDHPNVKSIRKY